MTSDHISELLNLARQWAEEGKDDLAHHALDVIDREAEETEGPPCPKCGEQERIEDTSTPAGARMTCKRCGASWNPKEIDSHG